MSALSFFLVLFVTVCLAQLLLYVTVAAIVRNRRGRTRMRSVRLLVCVGSGGHTAEMLRTLDAMPARKYSPRLYVVAGDDFTSERKLVQFERRFETAYAIEKIFRSRKVGQSFVSSIFTTLYSTVQCVPLIVRFRPQVLMCNGPGTCIPLCLVVAILNVLYITECKIVFIESVCRVKTLSLTGKILLYLADVFVVQWERLAETNHRIKYFGRLT